MSDAVFDTRLDARTLVEASAGTGKTWALAGLFLRAVIVGRLQVPQILAVTYTVAATQELRARVRLRLQQAAELAAQWHDGDAAVRDDESPQTVVLRRLLREALDAQPRESLLALRLRLARAARDIDLAAISTIHGFCQRLLAEHALETAQPLLAAEVETRNTAVRAQLAVDLWRAFARDAGGAAFLRREFGDTGTLADALTVLLAHEPLLPPAPDPVDDPDRALRSAWTELLQQFAAHGARARAEIEQAIADRVLSRAMDKAVDTEALWCWFGAQGAEAPSDVPKRLRTLTPQSLRARCLKNKDAHCPQSPLFDAVAVFLRVHAVRDLRRLHDLRDAAQRRDAARKRAFNLRDYDDLIDAVHAAVCDPQVGPALAQAVRARFPLALVDEFQDTDARQWTIFSTLFGSGGLVLVGDPKQAIYRFRGGDVHTYLAARDSADDRHALERNFRSRPCVLRAIEALFTQAQAEVDALGEGIAFQPVAPGGEARDDDLRCDGVPMPAIAFHIVPPRVVVEKGVAREKDWNKDDSIAHAADLCAEAIRELLSLSPSAQRRDGRALRALEPRDCAVLVRTHREAGAVRSALARRGVPAVASGRSSLFQTDEAQELLILLVALRSAADERRLRAALATRLLGGDAADIAALDDDGNALLRWQQTFEAWRTRWERHGPQALLAQVVAEHAPRLLAQTNGERRVTNYLQLAELMQAAGMRSLGAQGQLDWLRAAIADADPDDEAQQPRLESDTGRVQILTLHTSKGLEFPLVFLPFAGIGRKDPTPKDFALYPHQGRRVRQWRTDHAHAGAPTWADACAAHIAEERAEDMRLLYVGLTRARDALWLCCGALANHANTALHRLLGGSEPDRALLGALGTNAEISRGLPHTAIRRLPAQASADIPPAREATRRLQRDWWIHSFSQLHLHKAQGAHALADEAPADDERTYTAQVRSARDPRFAGARFGNVLHHALEHADFACWRDCVLRQAQSLPRTRSGDERSFIPATQREVLIAALRSQGYRDSDDEAALRLLAPLVARTLNAPLPVVRQAHHAPDFVRLCDLPPEARIAELEFHFGLRGAATGELLALLQAHGLLRGRRDFGAWQRLTGLMTGKLDLTYRVGERVYVLDYKSNDLPAYDQATLAERMAASEYDLQALLYAVAVHRWLRVRLGEVYAFDRHFGGARYVFSRGLDPQHPSQGVYAPELPRALVEAVDALLATPMAATASWSGA